MQPSYYQPEVNQEALQSTSFADLKAIRQHFQDHELHDHQYEDQIRVLDKEIERRIKHIFIY